MASQARSAATTQQLAIPFNRPFLSGSEYAYVQEAMRNGHISGDGPFTKRCEALLQQLTGCQRVLLTTSCTDALEMAALLLNIKPGDEVIVPSFTFVSTANAFVLRGAVPRFIDIRPDTLNLDDSKLEDLITPATKAIIPVHYAGVGCKMETISDVARRYRVAIVEDNAHGLFGRYHGRNLGTFGTFATLSFHETKNISCGEGGALLINESEYISHAEILREKGTDRSRFFRGEVDKYTWVDIGSSFLPSDILAAFLFAQLQSRELIMAARRRIWNFYSTNLRDWARNNNIQMPSVSDGSEQSFHMFYVVMPSFEERQALIEYLKSRGILAVFHYLPLHLSKMGNRFGGRSGQCPVTERVSDCLLRLPFYNDLSESEQSEVIEAIQSFDGWKPAPRRTAAAR